MADDIFWIQYQNFSIKKSRTGKLNTRLCSNITHALHNQICLNKVVRHTAFYRKFVHKPPTRHCVASFEWISAREFCRQQNKCKNLLINKKIANLLEIMSQQNISREDFQEIYYSYNESTLPLLSSWQTEQLAQVTAPEGTRCLLNSWFNRSSQLSQGLAVENKVIITSYPIIFVTVKNHVYLGTYCNATWDNIYCWPATKPGTVVKRLCSEALHELYPVAAAALEGNTIFYH